MRPGRNSYPGNAPRAGINRDSCAGGLFKLDQLRKSCQESLLALKKSLLHLNIADIGWGRTRSLATSRSTGKRDGLIDSWAKGLLNWGSKVGDKEVTVYEAIVSLLQVKESNRAIPSLPKNL
jgi:hypothetical protein